MKQCRLSHELIGLAVLLFALGCLIGDSLRAESAPAQTRTPAGDSVASDTLDGVVVDDGTAPLNANGSGTAAAVCAQPPAHDAIIVGSNAEVGSGARLKGKAVSTALGLVGGLLGGGGGGGRTQGPRLATCRIDDSEMTVFSDPETGVALKVGAKRTGDNVAIFAAIDKSPDTGTFQTSFLENAKGERMVPSDVGICELWGEWNLSVSWTRTTYVNNQVTSHESGGWGKADAFSLPGIVSSASAPDGTWKRLGFSNASHGAREVALTYAAPTSAISAAPVDLVIHVTRPEQSPVATVPFILRMSEGQQGFAFTREAETACVQQAQH